jgi:hypothetical protein
MISHTQARKENVGSGHNCPERSAAFLELGVYGGSFFKGSGGNEVADAHSLLFCSFNNLCRFLF